MPLFPIFEQKNARKSAFSKPPQSVWESGKKHKKSRPSGESYQELFLIYRTE